jgi:N-methylhydantoinase B
VMWERSIRPDSGGPGRYRGGCGQRLRLGVRTEREFRFAPLMDRIHHAPKGYDGGLNGALATVVLSTGETLTRKGTRDLAPGTEITLNLPGGGGLGEPAGRDPALILQDLRNGIVTPEAVERDYGVVARPDSSVEKLARV